MMMALGLTLVSAVYAQSESPATGGIIVDRVAVRFSAPEGAGRQRPHFIYERELAFEARLMALADPGHRRKSGPYRRHHLQAALEQHVAESLLASHRLDEAPKQAEIDGQMEAARRMLLDEIGGEQLLDEAAQAEGIDRLELRRFFRRRAMASLYLDQMVAPMLAPSTLELRRLHRSGKGPLADQPFDMAEPSLRRWYVSTRLRQAVSRYYQNARARLKIDFP
jgi:hypothetical protein